MQRYAPVQDAHVFPLNGTTDADQREREGEEKSAHLEHKTTKRPNRDFSTNRNATRI
jgi:hypothetical protein